MNLQRLVSVRTVIGLLVVCIILLGALVATTAVLLSPTAIDSKDAQLRELQSIVNLEKEEIIIKDLAVNQAANNYTQITYREFPYSGYLIVSGTSTTDNAWVKLDYDFNGKMYSFTQTLGNSGELFFSIPKTNAAAIYVGNNNLFAGATETITIVYHY